MTLYKTAIFITLAALMLLVMACAAPCALSSRATSPVEGTAQQLAGSEPAGLDPSFRLNNACCGGYYGMRPLDRMVFPAAVPFSPVPSMSQAMCQ